MTGPDGRYDTTAGGSYAADLEVASRGLLDVSERALATMQQKVSLDQLRGLQALRRLGGTSSVGALAEQLGVLSSTTSRLSDRLSERGLITRAPSPIDRRATLLELTPAGDAVLDEFVEVRVRALEQVTRSMPAADRAALLAGTRAFTRAHMEQALVEHNAPTLDAPPSQIHPSG